MDFSDLQTELDGYSHRTDLASLYTTFVDKATSRIGRDLRVQQMETTATVVLTAGAGTLPTDFTKMRSVFTIVGSASCELMPTGWTGIRPFAASANAFFYALHGTQIFVSPPSAQTLNLLYFAVPAALVNGVDTNSVLDAFPQIYLNASMAELSNFYQDYESASRWSSLYVNEVEQANLQARKARLSAGSAPLQVDTVYSVNRGV